MNGVLILTDDDKRRARDLAAFAARPERWFCPGSATPPGSAEGRYVWLQGYRCVFTWSIYQVGVYRHLSVTGDRLPPRPHVFVLAAALGFTGWKAADDGVEPGADWLSDDVRVPVPFVAVWQRIGAVELARARGAP